MVKRKKQKLKIKKTLEGDLDEVGPHSAPLFFNHFLIAFLFL
jgi:hypothetical protein